MRRRSASSAISLADAQRSGVRAFTGTIDHVCVSEQGVYLARSIRMESHGDAYKKDHYSVTNHAINAATELLRLTQSLQPDAIVMEMVLTSLDGLARSRPGSSTRRQTHCMS